MKNGFIHPGHRVNGFFACLYKFKKDNFCVVVVKNGHGTLNEFLNEWMDIADFLHANGTCSGKLKVTLIVNGSAWSNMVDSIICCISRTNE